MGCSNVKTDRGYRGACAHIKVSPFMSGIMTQSGTHKTTTVIF